MPQICGPYWSPVTITTHQWHQYPQSSVLWSAGFWTSNGCVCRTATTTKGFRNLLFYILVVFSLTSSVFNRKIAILAQLATILLKIENYAANSKFWAQPKIPQSTEILTAYHRIIFNVEEICTMYSEKVYVWMIWEQTLWFTTQSCRSVDTESLSFMFYLTTL